MIEYRDIYKAFDVPVLAGVSLRVETGQCLAIIGPSGTGKSVLLKITNGLLRPDRGDVFIDGESVFNSGPQALQKIRRKIGYVFQQAALFDSMTVYENVCQGLVDGDVWRNRTPETLQKVCDALEAVNLDPAQLLNKQPAELSGGMRKRVGLARAIVGRPEIVLYDEPVTGLDPVNTATVSLLMTAVRKSMKVTSIVVTHDIEQAVGIAEQIALLSGSKVRFVGTPAEFQASPDPLVRAFADRGAATAAALKLMEES
jgi:phospholipid/cholesterol/gamma-HCH transport system ATP-binding protein